jgi:hypothetical protein
VLPGGDGKRMFEKTIGRRPRRSEERGSKRGRYGRHLQDTFKTDKNNDDVVPRFIF